ncbi:hypothetical protein Ahy_A02g009102 [Arachis hypogaea]|uniref:Uncharacterized protein n=1 Tax=Arachis hypogaea TaxID=3818 RepID=A0A445EFV4_ARAHY|nr:hypothetical protein Ahy_A02g009102 [Arachis hypogaea]
MRSISQDHSKLDSNTIIEVLKPLFEADLSLKVRSITAEVQSRFNYTISYRKVWLAKQKSIAKIFGGWEVSYESLSIWCTTMCDKMLGAAVQVETFRTYHGQEELDGMKMLHRISWYFYPCISVQAL